MERQLYPLKFYPYLKEKVWGGNKLKTFLKKQTTGKCGESWEISGVSDNVSIVRNGFLEGNSLEELIEVYMGDLIGDRVFEKYGLEFPLLIKFIDANDKLSIQVHPDDELAGRRHQANGKTEMWYVMEAEKNANLIVGFNKEMDQKTYLDHLTKGTINEILNYERVHKGDVFFLPAGRIHAICEGILLAEIQQTSDVTYRIYDWDRKDQNGKYRELHNDLAADAIEYIKPKSYRTSYQVLKNNTSNIITCDYFKTNILEFDVPIDKEYVLLDSFVIYICIEGNLQIHYREKEKETLERGETLLIPALIDDVRLEPDGTAKILEVYIDDTKND